MTKFTNIEPAPNGIPMRVHVSAVKVFVQFPFMHDGKITEGRRESLKALGFKWSKAYKHWYAARTKLIVREFAKKYPETVTLFEKSEVMEPQSMVVPDYVPSSYLMNHQRAAAVRALKMPRFGFFHDTGCHAPGTKVIMDDGSFKCVEDICVGDRLMAPDHSQCSVKSRQVSKLYSGYDEMYRVIPVKGKPFIVNKSHILHLQQYKRCNGTEWYFTYINVSIRDYLKFLPTQEHNVKLVRSGVSFMRDENISEYLLRPIDPYFLGILLGDGSLHDTPAVTTSYQILVDEIYKQAEKFNIGIRKSELKDNKADTYHFTNGPAGGKPNHLKTILRSMGLGDAKAGTKFVPENYKYANLIENRLQILAGLIDTDGSLENNCYEFTSKSRRLSNDVIFITRSLGLAAYISEKPVNDIMYYRILISGDIDKIPCRLPHKQADIRKQKKNVLVTGFKVESVGWGPYYGFELDGDGLYMLDDFTVTHNTGKTLEAIEIFKQKQVRTLVVCPLSIIELAWLDDIKKFAPEIKACNLWKLLQSKSKVAKVRLRKAMEECNLFIINFEMFRARSEFFAELDIKMLIIDESSKIKAAKSKITKNIIKFADNVDFCYLFSGTPAPNSPLEYWSQVRVIHPSLFGQSFYSFRNQYFYAYGFGNYLWKMKPSMEEPFKQKLSTVSEVVRKEDVLDLPERTDNYRKVTLSKDERMAYDDMKDHLIAMVEGKEVVAANAAVKMLKLRQGTSGFFFDEDGEIVHTGNSKLNELMSLLEEIGDHQVLIWDHFHEEGDRIMKKLLKKAGRIDGTITNQQTRIDTVNAFIDGSLQYIVAHPGSLGHGVTLTNCSYAIYFSLSHSYELYVQSRDRIYRKGQKNACTYYHIVAANSVDNAIMRALKNKGDVVNAVLDYLRGG